MCNVVVQQGIDASKLSQAIYETIYAGAVAEAKAKAKTHQAREALAAKFEGRGVREPGPVQGSLFGGEPCE